MSSRASPRPSGSSSASTPTRRCSTCRWRRTSRSSSGQVGDEVTIWSSAQSPFTVRNLFCYAFKLPLNKVRVIVPHVGGGFGGKAGIHLEPLLACLSRKAGGRPVKMQATREEEFSLLPCRSALTYRIKTGVARRRPHHRAADDDVLGRRRIRRLRGQRHARVRVLGGRAVRHPERLARRVHDLHEQALRHGISRVRARRVLLGTRAAHATGGRGHRHGPARVPADEPAPARLDDADRRTRHGAHRQPAQVPGRGGRWRSATGG